MQSWLEGRIWVGKGAQQQGWPQAWEYSQAKLIQTLVRASQGVDWSWSQYIKSHHAQTSSGKGLPSHFWTRDNIRSILPGLWRKRTGLLLSGPKSSFQMKVNFAFHLETRSQSLEEEWRGTESMLLEVQCEVSTVSDDLGCHVICWCWSTVFSEVHSQRSHLPGNFRALHASFCWQALWRCWFHFPAGLGTCPHCQRYQKLVQWPWCYSAWLASKLAWPEPHRESMKMRDTRPNNADELKATVKETWASIPPQQCHKLITSMPRRIEAVIKSKLNWVHIQ